MWALHLAILLFFVHDRSPRLVYDERERRPRATQTIEAGRRLPVVRDREPVVPIGLRGAPRDLGADVHRRARGAGGPAGARRASEERAGDGDGRYYRRPAAVGRP